MKITKKTLLFIFLGMLLDIAAQDSADVSKTRVSIETDPATFVFNGYAAHVRIKPQRSKHWVIGAGAYALDLPSMMVDMNQKNKQMGWNVRIRSAFGLFGEYYLKTAGKKWFLGLQTSVQNYKITNDLIAGREIKHSNFLIMPSVGYTWQPFKFPFYVKPWAGLGYTAKITGDSSIDGKQYHISSFMAFATLHLGYRF